MKKGTYTPTKVNPPSVQAAEHRLEAIIDRHVRNGSIRAQASDQAVQVLTQIGRAASGLEALLALVGPGMEPARGALLAQIQAGIEQLRAEFGGEVA